ncbi:MAG: cell envelope integrity protein TolA [Bacteriovorax sp.]|nr:cell envelope integrity protein TolA [Bacteriovorax sp.]
MKLFKKNRARYSFAFIFSLALHFFAFGYIYNNIQREQSSKNLASQKNSNAPRSVKFDSVKFITRKQLQEIKDSRNKQIVANELNGKKERPKESRFAGEADQAFDRQTIAAANGVFKKAGLGNKNGSQTSIAQTQEPVTAPKKVAHNEKSKNLAPKTLQLSDLGSIHILKVEDEEKIQAAALVEMNRKLASESKHASAVGLDRGSADTTGLAQNNDFVQDVPLGDMTNLNTTEFKYYGFYHRIRQKLEQYWGSTIQSKAKNLYKSGRRLPASENLITAITVTLDDRGNILDIKIDGTSGIRELDQAAIESFNKAGPFPNPPKGLLIGGRAVIQWGFVVKS